MFRRFVLRTAFAFLGLALTASVAVAASISLIRDAEIENTIRAYATPLFTAAGLDAGSVRVYLVKDSRLNAFVAGGQNLFLNTGLLIRAEHAGQVIGVIAHETGHISGAHLARTHDALRNAATQSILAYVLGAAAAVAAGEPGVAGAIIAGGQQVAQRSFLQYSRTQESAADQAGLTFLERTGQSARGLEEFLSILEGQELLVAGRQDPYVRTHPITTERVAFVRSHLARSRFSDVPVKPELAEMHRRMRAKLIGFLEPPSRTFAVYKEGNNRLDARYARAIAYYRRPDLSRALPLIDGLIAEHPDDPYFHELKGQMLFENGRAEEALASYQRAVELLPDNALLRTSLGQILLELNDPDLIQSSVGHLNEAVRLDDRLAPAWRQLAIAHGRQGQIGLAALALAEEAMVRARKEQARAQAHRALKQLPEGSPGWQRAQDIKRAAEKTG